MPFDQHHREARRLSTKTTTVKPTVGKTIVHNADNE
jgi:hypothetical protein